MAVIVEGTPPTRLRFTFPESWHVDKFDAGNFYRKHILWLEGMKAVDILASRGDLLQLIEIKDFRGHGIQNLKKQESGRLIIDVSKKFVDTFAALVAAKRSEERGLAPFYTLLCDLQKRPVEVILFLERDDPETMLRRHKLTLADLTAKLRRLMSPYRVRCRVMDRRHMPKEIEWTVR
ncbi:hypothetical protein [Hydrogenimonas sp. SS33]|uniref:hypothetical protein n=1 Tax=Hydrogenimonas leucolamina TaxID=2954236 RepID=UPI00336C0C75